MTVTGGVRARLIHDSLYAHLRTGLELQGWFDSDRRHAPIHFIDRPENWDEPVAVNTMALTSIDVDTEEAETGSDLALDTLTATVDLFAESDSMGIDLITDARDVLRGRIGPRTTNTFSLVDYRDPTPAPIGYITVSNVQVSHSVVPMQRAWMEHWYSLHIEMQDWN